MSRRTNGLSLERIFVIINRFFPLKMFYTNVLHRHIYLYDFIVHKVSPIIWFATRQKLQNPSSVRKLSMPCECLIKIIRLIQV